MRAHIVQARKRYARLLEIFCGSGGGPVANAVHGLYFAAFLRKVYLYIHS